MANAMPVLPLVDSISVSPGLMRPRASAFFSITESSFAIGFVIGWCQDVGS